MKHSETVLTIDDLTLRFHTTRNVVTAVEHFSLSLTRGRIHALVGESGSGKSVTLKSILRLNPPGVTEYQTGSIIYHPAVPETNDKVNGGGTDSNGTQGDRLHSMDLLEVSESVLKSVRGNRIAMIFQEPGRYLNPVFRVRQLLIETIMTHTGTTQRKALEQAHSILHRVELFDSERVLESYPHELSGGMKQRVMIAIALSCLPDIILADEPTTALDVTVQAKILTLLKKVSTELGIAILFVTHDLAVVRSIADEVTVMYGGHLMETAEADSLFTAPLHPYTKSLLGAVPDISRRGKPLLAIPGNIPDGVIRPEGCIFHPRCPQAVVECRHTVPEFVHVRTKVPDSRHGVACIRVPREAVHV